MIAVVDYHKGNLKSVERGLRHVGGDAEITDDAEVIARAHAIVLPGVGAFADAARTMIELGQMQVIRQRIAEGVPFLGICLGLHLLFEEGDEGAPHVGDEGESQAGETPEASEAGESEDPQRPRGLAVLPGVVTALPREDARGRAYKIPHVGWNTVKYLPERSCPLFAGIPSGEYFYFTHSYVAPESSCTVAYTEHSTVFPSAVSYGEAAFGLQFHPEKSSDVGEEVLRNFVALAKGA